MLLHGWNGCTTGSCNSSRAVFDSTSMFLTLTSINSLDRLEPPGPSEIGRKYHLPGKRAVTPYSTEECTLLMPFFRANSALPSALVVIVLYCAEHMHT